MPVNAVPNEQMNKVHQSVMQINMKRDETQTEKISLPQLARRACPKQRPADQA
jgi:hypothetical protein